jgi:asparagine synthase (glutamine-hydrolysing)
VYGLLAPALAEVARGYDPAEAFRVYHRRVEGADCLDRMLYVDCRTWLPDDILVKVDRATMAASLEARSPFLDHRLAEFAARLPRPLKLAGRRTKVLLKALARRDLPAALVDRRKAGFNSPTADWLRGPLRGLAEEVLSAELAPLGVGWRPGLDGLWQGFQRGARQHQYALWGCFVLGLWQRHVRSARRADGVGGGEVWREVSQAPGRGAA